MARRPQKNMGRGGKGSKTELWHFADIICEETEAQEMGLGDNRQQSGHKQGRQSGPASYNNPGYTSGRI